jgi:DNA-binding XRE family transcriptional regulator/predicted RNase H-like HicB family nuclease
MQYAARLTREGKNTLIDFPDCPGCQTFAEPGEDVGARAEEALAGWLEAHLVAGQAPTEPKRVRRRTAGRSIEVPVAAKLAVKLQLRWARKRAGLTQAELARRAGLSQPAVARLEDPDYNPTLDMLERVAAALGARLEVALSAA